MDNLERNPMESLPDGWTAPERLDPKTLAKIVESYDGAVRDSIGLPGFVNAVLSSAVFVHEKGWVLVDRVVPGGAIFIHGGKFCEDRSHVGPFRALMDWLLRSTPGTLVVAPIPERSPAAMLLNEVGFVKTGFVPLDDSYGGEVKSTEIWALFPAKEEEAPEE